MKNDLYAEVFDEGQMSGNGSVCTKGTETVYTHKDISSLEFVIVLT